MTVSHIPINLKLGDHRLLLNNWSLSEAQAAAKKAQEGKTAAASYYTVQVLCQVMQMFYLKVFKFKCNINVIDLKVI